jgi:hypothetical protein
MTLGGRYRRQGFARVRRRLGALDATEPDERIIFDEATCGLMQAIFAHLEQEARRTAGG